MRALVALLLALLIVGCGGDDDGAANANTDSTATPTPERSARASESPEPVARPGLRLQRIGTFDSPVYVTAPPGDRQRLFVVEQGGRVMVMRGGRKLPRPFLDLRGRVLTGSERGLLSLAFAPDYARSGRFYVYYTANDGDIRIVEYRRSSPERADHGSERLVLSQAHPVSNHNGGLLLFGPDGLLYTGFGDGGGGGDLHGARGNGQSLGTLLGKILRIDPRPRGGRAYGIPSSNPFVGRTGVRGEIFAYGLRNPWRFAFDPRTGNLVVADVGQNDVEEVTIVRSPGANLGWRPFEGRRRYTPGESAPGHVPPVIQRFHSDGNCSITGGVVVRDPVLAALRGRYVFGDFCVGRIESARLRGARARDVRATRLRLEQLSSFGEDARGRVYATSLAGPVYRLAPRA
jgi:glucose/arabinose dehydrogenase